jgi:hypothetical protein
MCTERGTKRRLEAVTIGIDQYAKPEEQKHRRLDAKQEEAVHPWATVVQTVHKPRTHVNHTYRDYSNVMEEIGDVFPMDINDMTFSQKLHHILSQKEYHDYIHWLDHGRAFRVAVPKIFEQLICTAYFGHQRYNTFLCQLNNHGIKHLTRTPNRNAFYHESMLRGMPHLCRYMPEQKDARRKIPDPENEPDFNKISQDFPLFETDLNLDDLFPSLESTMEMEEEANDLFRVVSSSTANFMTFQPSSLLPIQNASVSPCNALFPMQAAPRFSNSNNDYTSFAGRFRIGASRNTSAVVAAAFLSTANAQRKPNFYKF